MEASPIKDVAEDRTVTKDAWQPDPMSESTGGSADPPGQPSNAMYVALEGVGKDDLSKKDRERLERCITEFLLCEVGISFENIRVFEGFGGIEFSGE